MNKKQIPTVKQYRLKQNAAPLSYLLPTRHTRRSPLLYFDKDQNINRPLRYSSNQKSPFEDEQDGNYIIEPIIFEDGFLTVAAKNPVLQQFLYYHPQRDIVFEEVDKEKDASEMIEELNVEVDALIKARQLTIGQLENVSRILFNVDVSKVSTAELKRDVLVYARNQPENFLYVLGDPELNLNARVALFFEKGLLAFSEDPYHVVGSYLKSEEGIEALKMLESNIEE